MAKIEYYIGERLVRSSERTYTHAVLRGDQVIACCGRLDLAEKEAANHKKVALGNVDFYQKLLKAKIAGKPYVIHTERFRGRNYTEKILLGEDIEYYESKVSQYEHQATLYHIEPLEAR